jgi:serine protease Do
LGVQIQEVTPRLARAFSLARPRGALVTRVVPGAPAALAGIREGDVILSFGQKTLERHDDLPWLASTAGVGQTVSLTLVRAGKELRIGVRLGRLPEPGQPATSPGTPKRVSKHQVLGMRLADVSRRERARLGIRGGAEVIAVDPGSLAARAGLRPGDLLLQLNGARCRNGADVVKRLGAIPEGKLIRLLVGRPEGRTFLAFTR